MAELEEVMEEEPDVDGILVWQNLSLLQNLHFPFTDSQFVSLSLLLFI